jgi:hypothetical protein
MLAALSLPRPSRPWQPAHDVLYVVFPASRLVFERTDEVCCAEEKDVLNAHKKRKAPSKQHEDLHIGDIGKPTHSISGRRRFAPKQFRSLV